MYFAYNERTKQNWKKLTVLNDHVVKFVFVSEVRGFCRRTHTNTQMVIIQIIPISSVLTLFLCIRISLERTNHEKMTFSAPAFHSSWMHVAYAEVGFNLKMYMAVIFQHFALFKELFLM